MVKRSSLVVLLSLICVYLAACTSSGTPAPTTTGLSLLPTIMVAATTSPAASPMVTLTPSDSPMPATKAPTPIRPPTTVTLAPFNPIVHFAPGEPITITSIRMMDAKSGWATGGLEGYGDHVLTTANGGSTWRDVTPAQERGEGGTLQSAVGYFQDTMTAWVVYDFGLNVPGRVNVWRTQDGGNTWQVSWPLDLSGISEAFTPSALQFVDGNTGWLLVHVATAMNHDYVALYRTNDSGVQWTRIIDPNSNDFIQPCSKTGMLFTDAKHGWLTGDCGGVAQGVLLYQSSDGGVTWQDVLLPEPADAPGIYTNMYMDCGSYDPFFFGNEVGYLSVQCFNFAGTPMTNNYYLYTTDDGGQTWISSTYPGKAIYYYSADVGWAIAPTINLTTNGGVTWKPIDRVTWSAELDFISEQIGWGVARTDTETALVHTEDGGRSWSIIETTVGP